MMVKKFCLMDRPCVCKVTFICQAYPPRAVNGDRGKYYEYGYFINYLTGFLEQLQRLKDRVEIMEEVLN